MGTLQRNDKIYFQMQMLLSEGLVWMKIITQAPHQRFVCNILNIASFSRILDSEFTVLRKTPPKKEKRKKEKKEFK